jgi:hypothetical protein
MYVDHLQTVHQQQTPVHRDIAVMVAHVIKIVLVNIQPPTVIINAKVTTVLHESHQIHIGVTVTQITEQLHQIKV